MLSGVKKLLSKLMVLFIFALAIVSFVSFAQAGKSKSLENPFETSFDASPFGFEINGEDGKSYGVRWAEPRKIRKVIVEFENSKVVPNPSAIKLQYWNKSWNGQSDPIKAERSAGGVGWEAMDDWTNGQFKDVVCDAQAEGSALIFTFDSTKKEFDKIKSGVKYRKTLWIRISSDNPIPKPKRICAYTESFYKPLTVRIQFGQPLIKDINISGEDKCRLEVFNGHVKTVRPLNQSSVHVDSDSSWIIPKSGIGGIEADILMATDPLASYKYDATVVTVRSAYRSFSFSADEISTGDRILVDDLGVLATRSDDPVALDEYRYQLKNEFSGKTVYDRVFSENEQTLSRAWNDMPLKRQLYFWHALPGNRNSLCQFPNANIVIPRQNRNVENSDKDTSRKLWKTGDGGHGGLTIKLGLPNASQIKRELKDGWLPVLRSWCEEGPIYYELTSVMDMLNRDLNDVALDAPTVLMVKGRFINLSDSQTATAKFFLESVDKENESLVMEQDKVIAESNEGPRFRFLVETNGNGDFKKHDRGIVWSKELGPRQDCTIMFSIPTITLTSDDEIKSLRDRNFDADANRICDFWQKITAEGTQINTPEKWLNDFYKAHVRHMVVNCLKELHSDRLHAHVSTHHYGVFPDESCMMISDLDRRGYHDLARRCLDAFIYYQGTKSMPGNFSSKNGLFYGSAGYEAGGYNKSHGWVMWAMAEHWKYTRDRGWMEKNAPKLIESCEWVINERKSNLKLNPDGTKPLYYGWLPTGSLEDVTDYWHWMVTNACTVWGFEAVANTLADYGHPQAGRLQQEAKAYHDDFMNSMEEGRILAPVVKLRDGTYVPKYPSRVYERGRSHGWLRETLEGSIHLLITNTLDINSYKAKWILNDFEDNLYISDIYGYAIPNFDNFWFSRGGFSMQANLLGGPLPYLWRDETKHFLRAYFNGFASAFDPEVRMSNEHSLPELGYPAGSHFKSSDEAQSTYWLRLMFVSEEGNNLYLGKALPRYWLKDGQSVRIKNAATYFGPLSLTIESQAGKDRIKAVVEPSQRNCPQNIYVRIRHPDSKPIKSVTINGQPYTQFDVKKEWVILKGDVKGTQEIIASY